MIARNARLLAVGHVTKAHGTKGELFVWPLTDHTEDVFAEGMMLQVADEDGVTDVSDTLTVARARGFKRGLLVLFDGIADRDAAEAYSGRYLYASSAVLAPPGEDEVYYHDLVGLRVETVAGEDVGMVRRVFEMKPADQLEIEGQDGVLRLVPLIRPIVQAVDVEQGRVVIDPPPGLLEL
ncbi:MAG: ribosome maturation factor RimM [Gemmatimonadetes bacterium]|nr:ribosome maturation factor RimM [Gemmatimonadota bacterium]